MRLSILFAVGAALGVALGCSTTISSGDDGGGPPLDAARTRMDAGPPDGGPPDDGAPDDGRLDRGPFPECAADAECDDGDACTDDRCDLVTGTCVRGPVDEDGDGFTPIGCGGEDCDDDAATGRLVNPDATEVCDDVVDNDCDGLADAVDRLDCPPTNDTCRTPRVLRTGLQFFGSEGLAEDYELDCNRSLGLVDAVFRFTIPEERDVTIEAVGLVFGMEIREARRCAEDGAGLACARERRPGGPPESIGLELTRTRLGSLAAGTYDVIVSVRQRPELHTIELTSAPVSTPPPIDRCDASTPVITGTTTVSGAFDTIADDYPNLPCGGRVDPTPELAYALTLAVPSAVTVNATLTDRRDRQRNTRFAVVRRCTDPFGTSLRCRTSGGGVPDPIDLASLPAGPYWILVEPDTNPLSIADYAIDVTVTPL